MVRRPTVLMLRHGEKPHVHEMRRAKGGVSEVVSMGMMGMKEMRCSTSLQEVLMWTGRTW